MASNITRKVKTKVPESKKDNTYYVYRELNTLRAAKSRQKKREEDMKFKTSLFNIEELNKKLKQNIINLEAELNRLVNLYKLKISNSSITINGNELINSLSIDNQSIDNNTYLIEIT
jgi:hypothetical protein